MPILFQGVRVAAVAFICLCSSVAAWAELQRLQPPNDELLNTRPVANVYFAGEVNPIKIKELISAIDEINLYYSKVKNINLYIISYGGDIDSGLAAYRAIKSSSIPITAINLSAIGSAGTLLFCASDDRYSVKGSRFFLHPAAAFSYATAIQPHTHYPPDEITRLQQWVASYTKAVADIYRHCTNFKPAEIDALLTSEYSSKIISEDEAQARELIKGIRDKISPAALIYYITDTASPTK